MTNASQLKIVLLATKGPCKRKGKVLKKIDHPFDGFVFTDAV